MSEAEGGLSETLFLLPPDARLMAVTDLSLRLQAKIGPAAPGCAIFSAAWVSSGASAR